jgi:glycosyltransferase involved in cell wall biosynthesis
MKIGFFYVPYYPLTMGRSVHGYNLVRALKKRGHTILSCLGVGDPECVQYERSKWGALKVARYADVLYIRIAGRPVHGYLERATLLKLLRPFSLPVVWEVNAPVEELQGSYPPGRERDAMINRENSKRKALAYLVDAGIGVSDVLKRYISDVLSIKTSYSIPNGSDPDLFDPARAAETVLDRFPDTFKVFWMGNAGTPWQGIELMLEVAEKMERRDRHVLFILVTGESLVTLPVRSNVLLLRQMSYSDLPHYLAAADACLCLYKPYDWISYGFYGSSLKLFDYMAAGKPVIASDMGQLAQVIRHGDNGMLVPDDSEAIIETMCMLKADRERGAQMGMRARQDVIGYYNWDRVAQETEAALAAACG